MHNAKPHSILACIKILQPASYASVQNYNQPCPWALLITCVGKEREKEKHVPKGGLSPRLKAPP
jgi:hypothetical protein